ncbi:MAG: CotH kinase family protein [Spirochaetales bacterium]|nr:CotH kinase family protein [Spirochaetales bacterium]
MSKKNKILCLFIMLFSFFVSNIFSAETDVEKNNETAKELTGDILFSPPSGTFQSSINVSLSSTISNAQIRYTTNGSVPTSNSSLYNGPLTFSSTTQLRAQTFVNGALTGEMGSAVYIACSSSTRHDLPLVIIDGYRKGKPSRDYQDMAIAFMEFNGQESTLLQKPVVITRGAYHLRGQSSANFQKVPYRIELRNNNDDDAKYDIFGMGADGDWVLIGPFADKTLIRTSYSYEAGRELGLFSPDYQFVEVYINQNDGFVDAADYQGVYLFAETIERAKNRIDIANLKAEDLTEPEITGGYIMQFNMSAAEEPIVRGTGWNDLEVKDPDDLLPEQLSWIANYIQKVQNSIHSSNPTDPVSGYPAYIDVDSFADYIIHNELGKQPDSYVRSTYIYKDKEEKLKAGPLWDYNLAYDCFTGFGWGTTSNVEGWQYGSGMMGFNVVCDWFNTLMQNTTFQNRVKQRWQELRSGPLSDQELINRVDALANPIANGAKRNFQKWPNLQTKTVGNFSTQTTQTWEEQIQILKNYLLNRSDWIDQSWGTALPYTMTPTPDNTPTPTSTNLGDVNTDGAINIVDALLIAQFYVNMVPSNFNRTNADVNSDGNINIVDALLIAQYYVNIIDSFPKA